MIRHAGLYQTLSAGITDVTDATEFMRVAVTLSTGGVAEMSDVVRALAATLNAYSLGVEEAEKISDLLFTTVRLGMTTMPELAHSIGRVIVNDFLSLGPCAVTFLSILILSFAINLVIFQVFNCFVLLYDNTFVVV